MSIVTIVLEQKVGNQDLTYHPIKQNAPKKYDFRTLRITPISNDHSPTSRQSSLSSTYVKRVWDGKDDPHIVPAQVSKGSFLLRRDRVASRAFLELLASVSFMEGAMGSVVPSYYGEVCGVINSQVGLLIG